jgi:hypothetical protein
MTASPLAIASSTTRASGCCWVEGSHSTWQIEVQLQAQKAMKAWFVHVRGGYHTPFAGKDRRDMTRFSFC